MMNLIIDDGLKLFGSDFFNTFQTSFMPTNEPNPDSDYYLDIGDVLNIQMVGQKNMVDDYIIDGSGSISLEDIGMSNYSRNVSRRSIFINKIEDKFYIYRYRCFYKS